MQQEDVAINYVHVTNILRETLHESYRALRGGNSEDIHNCAGVLRTTVSTVEHIVREQDRRTDLVPDQRLGYLHLCMLVGFAHRVLAKLPH